MLKPLIIVTSFNRKRETEVTLTSLEATLLPGQAEVVLVDNGSTDGTAELVEGWAARTGASAHLLPDNIGCPAALNLALKHHRSPGQSAVKLDNDVRLLGQGWAGMVGLLATTQQSVAMISADYPGVLRGREIPGAATFEWGGSPVAQARLLVGHAVWHTGAFMDAVGYFDVLADDHLYGFEDLLMSAKAQALGQAMLVWGGWRIENVQRFNSLGRKVQTAHVEAMRPLYDARMQAIVAGGTVCCDANGRPV